MSSEFRVNRGEINRLNKAIAAEEQNINAIFQQMGQSYFAAHKDDPEEAQAANVRAVLDALERVECIKEQINVLRGIAICPGCKAEVSVTAAFCSRCGTRMPTQTPPAPPAPEGPVCPNCGNRCRPGVNFCNRCGTRLAQAAPIPEPVPTPAPAPTPEPVPTPTPELPAKKICPNCGTELDPAFRFCLECGTPV